MSFKILIVDDNAIIRRAVRELVEHDRALEVCGEAEDGRSAIDMVKQLGPDAVVLDLAMPVMNGLVAARQIASIAPGVAIILFTLYDSEPLRQEARRAGIHEVVSKVEGCPDHLLSSLKVACANKHQNRVA